MFSSLRTFYVALNVFLTTFFLLLLCSSDLLAQETVLIFDAPSEETLPRNFRTTTFPFIDTRTLPSRLGFDHLALSGSGQFSVKQFDFMRARIPKSLVVIDLRQEYHGFLNGVAVCWFSSRDAANKGFSFSKVMFGEEKKLAGLLNQDLVTLGTSIKKKPNGDFTVVTEAGIKPDTVFSEQELLASRGDGYFRIASTDHLRPTNVSVERFVLFIRQLEPDVWVHFHCRAGIGRTTTFMLMYDMLRNAHTLNFETLVKRQHYIGGYDFLNKKRIETGWKKKSGREKVDFLRRFYDYAKNNPNGLNESWMEWLEH